MRAPPDAHEIHLWRAPLDVSPQLAARFASTLSEDEHRRVERLRRPTDQSRYVSGRGWLRQLLGGYLEAEPVTLTLVADARGKPRLSLPSAPWLRFNLSHSAALAVFAVAYEREVGVDVEAIRDDVEIDGISERVFTARQCQELAALAPAERAPAFYAMWTRNEAYVKARGTGLAGADSGTDPPPGWRVATFDAGSGYAAAVAVEGDRVRVPPTATDLEV